MPGFFEINNMNTLEPSDSLRNVNVMHLYEDLLEEDARRLHFLFMRGLRRGVQMPAEFASMTHDFDAPFDDLGRRPQRLQTMCEVMDESLSYGSVNSKPTPSTANLYVLLIRAAKGEHVQLDAQALLEKMAWAWAEVNAEVNE